MSRPNSVCVIGLGYIGLPTAAILACNGVRVHGTDISTNTVETVNQGKVPFVEPALADYLLQAVQAGQLTASTSVQAADAYVIAVPTPIRADKSADLDAVRAASEALAAVVASGDLVILESTSPPGTTEAVGRWIVASRPDLVGADGSIDLLLAHCPERVLPGKIMTELVDNDRIVGGITPAAAAAGADLYRVFCRGQLLLTDARTAELAKLVENSYRDVNIAFANELSLICHHLGIDVRELIELSNHHPRVEILQPGPGVGGHCLAVDPYFIVEADPVNSRLIATARAVNSAKPAWVVDQVLAAVTSETPTIATLGLAFKPNIDDLRESPSIEITAQLAGRLPQGKILAVEPHVTSLPASLAGLSNVTLVTLPEALAAADVVAVLVGHQAFTSPPAIAPDTKVVDVIGLWQRS